MPGWAQGRPRKLHYTYGLGTKDWLAKLANLATNAQRSRAFFHAFSAFIFHNTTMRYIYM